MNDSYTRHKINITYKGKTYTRLGDLAKAAGLPASKLQSRWQRGIRNPHELLLKDKIRTSPRNPVPIKYKGIIYQSLKDFALANNLSYNKVLIYNGKYGINDGNKLVELAQPQNTIGILNKVTKEDLAFVDDYLNSQGLLSIKQVHDATGISINVLGEVITRNKRRQNNNLGIEPSDIAKVKRNKQEDDRAVNWYVIPKRAFLPSAIEHIKQRQQFRESLIQVPFENDNYFYSPKDKTVWGLRKVSGAIKQLTPYPKDTYTFRGHNSKCYTFSVKDIEDLIAHPEIKGEQLISKKELIKKIDIGSAVYDARHVSRHIGPQHHRYTEQGKKVSGWLPEEIEKAKQKYPGLMEKKRK